MALSLSDLLKRMLEMGGSDLHITTNSPPQIRVHGHLVPLDLPQMTPTRTITFVHATRLPLAAPDFAAKGSAGGRAGQAGAHCVLQGR